MAIHPCGENLHLIDLDLPREGFRRFISAWLYTPPGAAILVDPGPRSSIPVLLDALTSLGIRELDAILLTHIHLDHAGGAGLLAARYPAARIVCHPQGIRHMVSPAKLWEGSRKVLGEIAELYGEIAPLAAENVSYEERLTIGPVTVSALPTPGHAAHHLCFLADGILFAGEVAGITYPLEGGIYLRPATPPVFDYEIYRGSLERAAALPASRLCFGHWGCRTDPEDVFALGLRQLDAWLETVDAHLTRGSMPLEEAVFADLLAREEGMARYGELPPDIQAREKYFSTNSIRGMREYREGRRTSPGKPS